jgi:hypothetical protein
MSDTKLEPCCRCQATGCPWDRIGDKVLCPDCQQQLVMGEGETLVEALLNRQCVVCGTLGTVPYSTVPRDDDEPVDIDLCPRHFYDFMAWCLDQDAYQAIRRVLHERRLPAQAIFLLHATFYDKQGRRRYLAPHEE